MKPLAQYPEPYHTPDYIRPLAKYLADYLDDDYFIYDQVDYERLDMDDIYELLEQALDAYENTEQVKIRIERVWPAI